MELPITANSVLAKATTPYQYDADRTAAEPEDRKMFDAAVRSAVNKGNALRFDYVWQPKQTLAQGKHVVSTVGLAVACRNKQPITLNGRPYKLMFETKTGSVLAMHTVAPADDAARLSWSKQLQTGIYLATSTQHRGEGNFTHNADTGNWLVVTPLPPKALKKFLEVYEAEGVPVDAGLSQHMEEDENGMSPYADRPANLP